MEDKSASIQAAAAADAERSPPFPLAASLFVASAFFVGLIVAGGGG